MPRPYKGFSGVAFHQVQAGPESPAATPSMATTMATQWMAGKIAGRFGKSAQTEVCATKGDGLMWRCEVT